LLAESANRRSVERQVVVRLDQELLVVVQHVQPAFEIAEEHRHGFDALLVAEILETLLLDLVGRDAILALLFGGEIQFFELAIRQHQKIAKIVTHVSPLKTGRRSPPFTPEPALAGSSANLCDVSPMLAIDGRRSPPFTPEPALAGSSANLCDVRSMLAIDGRRAPPNVELFCRLVFLKRGAETRRVTRLHERRWAKGKL